MTTENRKQRLIDMRDEVYREIEKKTVQLNNALYLLRLSIEHGQTWNVETWCDEITELNQDIVALRAEHDKISSII